MVQVIALGGELLKAERNAKPCTPSQRGLYCAGRSLVKRAEGRNHKDIRNG